MAEDGDACVDRVGAAEPGAAAATGLALAAVHQQLELEIALLAGAGPVGADGGAVGPDRCLEAAPDLRVEPPVIVRYELPRRLGGIDSRRVERLIGVDVPDAGEVLLVHDHFLVRLA